MIAATKSNDTLVPKVHRLTSCDEGSMVGSLARMMTVQSQSTCAVIQCISAIIVDHLNSSNMCSNDLKAIFSDRYSNFFPVHGWTKDKRFQVLHVENFFSKILNTTEMEYECIVVVLIYIERIIRTGKVVITETNWKSLVFISCLLASKVWDDLSMINSDFVCAMEGQISLKDANKLELWTLQLLSFNVYVSSDEYDHYHSVILSLITQCVTEQSDQSALDSESSASENSIYTTSTVRLFHHGHSLPPATSTTTPAKHSSCSISGSASSIRVHPDPLYVHRQPLKHDVVQQNRPIILSTRKKLASALSKLLRFRRRKAHSLS